MVDGGGLRKPLYPEGYRGFESLSLRQPSLAYGELRLGLAEVRRPFGAHEGGRLGRRVEALSEGCLAEAAQRRRRKPRRRTARICSPSLTLRGENASDGSPRIILLPLVTTFHPSLVKPQRRFSCAVRLDSLSRSWSPRLSRPLRHHPRHAWSPTPAARRRCPGRR